MSNTPKDDHIQVMGDELLVTSRVDMPDWHVTEYRKACIMVSQRPYYVARYKMRNKHHYEYLLKPWHDGLDLPGHRIYYDEDYRSHRDKVVRAHLIGRGLGPVLFILSPLIGLLWSETKRVLEEKANLDAYSATRANLMVEFLAVVLAAAFFLIYTWVNAMGGHSFGLGPFIWVIVILGPDVLFRWDQIIRDGPLYGFYEWVFSWLR